MLTPSHSRCFLVGWLGTASLWCWWWHPTAVQAQMVVTMGDGYASGAGMKRLERQYDDPECLRMNDELPGGWYADIYELPHINTACLDDGIPSMENQFALLQEYYPEEAAVNFTGSVFLITVGLDRFTNDVGAFFREIVVACHVFPFCNTDPELFTFDEEIDRTARRLEVFLRELAEKASGAAIRLIQNPLLFFGDSSANAFAGRCWARGLSRPEATALDQVIFDFNGAMLDRVLQVRQQYPQVSLQSLLAPIDRGVCSLLPWRRQIHRVRPLVGLYPTPEGYRAIYDHMKDRIYFD